ncbi:MAG: hypothetical protein JST86_09985 [Bacteroidetes bacterium]|nr:hypothetical protein [Bacteroidota bacterium]
MRTLSRIILLITLYLCAPGIPAQTRIIDNLKRSIRLAGNQQQQLKAIFDLCDLGYTLHPDTLMVYALQGLSLSQQMKDMDSELNAQFYITGALTAKGLIDSSLSLADKALDLASSKLDDPALLANLYNQKGRCYVRKNQYKEAIEMGYQTIAYGEKAGDVLLQVKGKTLIGWAYLEMEQLRDALNWHLKALHTTNDSVLLGKYAILFANLATNYNGVGQIDSAYYFIDKGVYYARKYENLFALSNCLAIESELYVKNGKAKLSEPLLKEVVEIRKLIGDPFYIASDLSQLGFYYAHYGQPEKGIEVCNEGIALAMKYKLDTKLFFLYGSLADNYKALGDTEKYAAVLEKIIALKDSVYQKNSAAALSEMQAKYDVQKKENLIIQQKFDIRQKEYLFYGSLLLLLLGALAGWVIFINYKRKQKIKLLQMQEEEKIISAIAVTRAGENERKRIAADLHDNIGAYASAISAEVEKIGDSVEVKHKGTYENLKLHSQEIINSLRDTIWVLNKENITLTGISDRVKNLLNKLRPTYNHIQFTTSERITKDVVISSKVAFNIFRIIQEAVHNAIKHSGAKNILVNMIANDTVTIQVKDDGTGFAPNPSSATGNGMLNMKSRAQDAGLQLDITSHGGEGTTVEVRLATTN